MQHLPGRPILRLLLVLLFGDTVNPPTYLPPAP
jgi:hypothetical protein